MRRGKGGAGSVPAATASVPARESVAEIASVIQGHVEDLPAEVEGGSGRLERAWTLTVTDGAPRVSSAVRVGGEPDGALAYAQLAGIAAALRGAGLRPVEVFEGWRTVAFDIHPVGVSAPAPAPAAASAPDPATPVGAQPETTAGPVTAAPPADAPAPAAAEETAVVTTAGTDSAGTDSAGTEPTGTEPAGTQSADTEAAGEESAESRPAGEGTPAAASPAPVPAPARRRRFRFRGVRPATSVPAGVGAGEPVAAASEPAA